MNKYFIDKNITELCDDMASNFDGHVKTSDVRKILLTLWKHCRKNTWYSSYSLKHEVENIISSAENEHKYCSEYVVKNILFEMFLNNMVEIGVFEGIHSRPTIRKIYDDELKNIIGEMDKNIHFKYRDNYNLNIG